MASNVLAALVASLVAAILAPAGPKATASLVLTGGRIWTGDPGRPWTSAIAVSPAGILAVGDDAEVARLAAPGARRIDLLGRFAMPGINDAHIHFLRGSLRLTQLDLNGARSLGEIQERLARFAKENPGPAGLEPGAPRRHRGPRGPRRAPGVDPRDRGRRGAHGPRRLRQARSRTSSC
jgi:hypothetical protein